MKGLGEKIKLLRKKMGMTLVTISEKTGIDKATLSRIESGKMPGTLNSHMKIAEVLGVRLPELYEDVLTEQARSKDKTVREKVEVFSHSSKAVAELLTTGVLQKKMMPLLLTLKPGGKTVKEEYPLATERFIYVLEGVVELLTDQETQKLGQGESIYFNASRSHYLRNNSQDEAKCLSVITPVSL